MPNSSPDPLAAAALTAAPFLAAATTEELGAAAADPQQEQLKCPRCDSSNTKFCYYNNYNLSQPRHFCKNCRRYWTKGGSLRNIPVGGGSRKNSSSSSSKRPSSSAAAAASSPPSNPAKRPAPQQQQQQRAPPSSDPDFLLKPEPVSALYPPPTPEDKMLEINGTFSSLLHSSDQFADLNFLDGFGAAAGCESNKGLGSGSGSGENPDPQPQMTESFLGWGGAWPDLAIYTSPGSRFQ